MSKILPISHKKFIKKLRTLSFEGPFSGGKHLFMQKESLVLHIPNPHKRKDIRAPLLKRILKQAQIDVDTWNRI